MGSTSLSKLEDLEETIRYRFGRDARCSRLYGSCEEQISVARCLWGCPAGTTLNEIWRVLRSHPDLTATTVKVILNDFVASGIAPIFGNRYRLSPAARGEKSNKRGGLDRRPCAVATARYAAKSISVTRRCPQRGEPAAHSLFQSKRPPMGRLNTSSGLTKTNGQNYCPPPPDFAYRRRDLCRAGQYRFSPSSQARQAQFDYENCPREGAAKAEAIQAMADGQPWSEIQLQDRRVYDSERRTRLTRSEMLKESRGSRSLSCGTTFPK